MKALLPIVAACFTLSAVAPGGEVYNLKVLTDASPDYSDMSSLVDSVTAQWPTAQEQCWAMFYWNHIARRQTAPMQLHGLELTDPIRQFNDYGYTMCSTVSGINCALWHHMGLRVKFWDITLHTVSEVFYDDRWHMYDNSMSALYTLCDGTTLAAVDDIGREGACAASGGHREPGHIAKYHCLYSTGPHGFLTGADTQRSLEEEAHCFNPNGLKYRSYYNNWDYGHRYILNLRENESYTRHYRSLGASEDFYVPNGGKDPETRYRIRGNGEWVLKPSLTAAALKSLSHQNIVASKSGFQPSSAGQTAEVIFKVQGANVLTSQSLQAAFVRRGAGDAATISFSTNNGLAWTEVWSARETGELVAEVKPRVNGAYETLLKVTLKAEKSAADISLRDIEIRSTTMLNAKTQPRLILGRNTIYVGAGDQLDSIVFWPELQNGRYREHIVEEKSIISTAKHPGYQGTVHPAVANEDAYLVYRLDAPRDIRRVQFGGRFYNRAPKSHIDMLYSLDAGRTWTNCWSLRRIEQPWDVIHYETVQIPPGHRSVHVKYLLNSPDPSPSGCSIYAVRMEANYLPIDATYKPVQVKFSWSERKPNRKLVERSHTQTIPGLPFRYNINVGGEDHPVMNSLRVQLQDPASAVKEGYSDGKDVGGEKWLPQWVTYGSNLAIGKSYTLSVPSSTNWDAGDPDGKKLTTGAGGPSYAGGTSYRSAALWPQNANPVITVDLGAESHCASFGMNLHGYPWWDALKGEMQDTVEVLTSTDGKQYEARGFLKMNLWWKDIPVNYMWTDEETMNSATFRLIPDQPIKTRYVQFKISNKRFFACAGLEVLDAIHRKPFDLRIKLP